MDTVAAPIGRREKRKQEIRTRIEDAAYALFQRQGIDDTSIEQICEEADVADLEGINDLIEKSDGFLAPLPFLLGAKKVFFRHHLEDRPHVLSHPAMDENEAVLEFLASLRTYQVVANQRMPGKESSAAYAEFRVVLAGDASLDELDARPDASRILPSPAAATEPFAKDCTRCDQSPFSFVKRTG